MQDQSEIVQQAKILSKEKRKEILMSFKEPELHKFLKELFEKMEPNYVIEITHQSGELGKDLVIVKKDKISMDVIGVVVKVGDIRGKTRGRVDELKTQVKTALASGTDRRVEVIESQVQQALNHPAEMKTIFNELKISKVLILLAGGISRQARKRLKGELVRNIEIKDINWLIDKFTNYYPQIFFEGKVMDFLHQKINELERKHSLTKKRMNLSDYFVDPTVATIDVPVKFDEGDLALIMEKERMPFLRLKSILTPARRIILVGDPGVGKSGALAKLTIDMLKESSRLLFRGVSKKQTIEIPILVSAKEILEADDGGTLLKKYFVTQDVEHRFKVKVLMVDALDEVSPTQGNEVMEKAERFSQELASSLLITSRKIDIIKTPPAGFEKYELLPFEYGQALKLFEKLARSKEVLGSLRDGLEKIKFQIPMVPLSLILLIDLVEEKKEIPASITELYERFSDLMLGRWDRDKGIEVLFEYVLKSNFLTELAFMEFLEKEKLEISQEEFEGFSKNYASRYGWDEESLQRFIKEIKRSGILRMEEGVVFRHRSFLDYFAGRYIFDKRADFKNLDDFVVKIYFNDIWGDTAFFYIGSLREVKKTIIDRIFANKDTGLSTYIDKFLTGTLLQAGWNSPTKIKYYGIEKAATFARVIRDEFLKIAEKNKVKIPLIFADFLVITLSDLAFGSAFLFKEVNSLFSGLSRKLCKEDLYMMLSLLWSIQRFLSQDELSEAVNNFLETISRIPNLDVKEEARSLLFLMIMKKGDKNIVRSIKRKLNRLKMRYPETFRELLPRRKKGFRKK